MTPPPPDLLTYIQVLLPALGGGGLIGAIVLLYKARSESRKTQAEAGRADADSEKVGIEGAAALTAATLTLIQPFREQVAALSDRCSHAETQVRQLTDNVDDLTRKVRTLSADLDDAHNLLARNGIPVPPKNGK